MVLFCIKKNIGFYRTFKLWISPAISQLLLTCEILMSILLMQNGYLSAESLLVFTYIIGPLFLLLIPAQTLSIVTSALGRNKLCLYKLRWFTFFCSVALGVCTAGFIASSCFSLFFVDLLQMNESFLDLSQQAFLAFSMAPIAVCWRRFYQGMLTLQGNNHYLIYACFARLTCTLTLLYMMIHTFEVLPVILSAGISISVSCVIESIIVGVIAEKLEKKHLSDTLQYSLGISYLCRFYALLVSSGLFATISVSVLTAGISRGNEAPLSLLVWPSIRALRSLFAGSIGELEAVIAIFKPHSKELEQSRKVVYFLAFGAVLLSLALGKTSLGRWYFEEINGLSSKASSFVLGTIFYLTMTLILYPFRCWLCGKLESYHFPQAVFKGLVIHNIVMFAFLYAGLTYTSIFTFSGLELALLAQFLGLLVETIYLQWGSQKIARTR